MKKTILFMVALATLAACEAPQTLDEYRPVVDPKARSSRHYDRDLIECRQIAKAAEADYTKRQNDEMGQRLIVGMLAGAVVGAAVGGNSDWAAYGAANGAAAGVISTDTELAHGGPRRIIDRCMNERGHAILSDLGRG